jgi:hypothetical protein
MVVDYETVASAIVKPLMKNNNFMGVSIVSTNADSFATNAPILTQCPPVRAKTREYIDTQIFTPAVQALDVASAKRACQAILDEWKADLRMASTISIRSTVLQIVFQLLGGVRIGKADSDRMTFQYMRRFVEFSLFSRYLPGLLGLLGSREAVRRDVYFKLRASGLDLQTIDMTLFAALFSVGTMVLRCIEDLRRFGVVYEDLAPKQKRQLMFEVQRLYPTVTTVHRVVEQDETVSVLGRRFQVRTGEEIAYPFYCANRDPRRFPNPEAMDLNRPAADYEAILSWSKGPHSCPGKELSIMTALLLLDTLAERYRLSDLRVFNPEF